MEPDATHSQDEASAGEAPTAPDEGMTLDDNEAAAQVRGVDHPVFWYAVACRGEAAPRPTIDSRSLEQLHVDLSAARRQGLDLFVTYGIPGSRTGAAVFVTADIVSIAYLLEHEMRALEVPGSDGDDGDDGEDDGDEPQDPRRGAPPQYVAPGPPEAPKKLKLFEGR